MIIDTNVGQFELIKNTKEAFDIIKFHERYIEELFDKYAYIVGDLSAGILRIKGFDGDAKSPNSFKTIPDYLNESASYGAPYYILKRIGKAKTNAKK